MTITETVSQLAAQAAPVVGTFVLAVVGWLGAHVVAFVRARTKNALVLGFTDRLTTEIEAAVAAADQVAVADLKAGAANGKLTPADAARIKTDVLAQVQHNLGGDKWIAEAEKVIGVTDVESFLSTRIEAAVAKLAQEKDQMLALMPLPAPQVDPAAIVKAAHQAVAIAAEAAASTAAKQA